MHVCKTSNPIFYCRALLLIPSIDHSVALAAAHSVISLFWQLYRPLHGLNDLFLFSNVFFFALPAFQRY